MKKDSELIQKDFSFLQKMSTEELQEILRRDMDLDKDESDMDLVLNVMEVLATRESTSEDTPEAEIALLKLRELINNRDKMFSNTDSSEADESTVTKHSRRKLLWLRFVSVAAVVVLIISISLSAASAKGYDLWGGMVRWTRESFSFGGKDSSFDRHTSFSDLEAVLIDNGINAHILPNWLPEQYMCEDIQTYMSPKTIRIVATTSTGENDLLIQVIKNCESNQDSQHYEISDESALEYETHGIRHYIVKNNNRVLITWAYENIQVLLEFSDATIDTARIIESIYEE